jgi:hypothetical protein
VHTRWSIGEPAWAIDFGIVDRLKCGDSQEEEFQSLILPRDVIASCSRMQPLKQPLGAYVRDAIGLLSTDQGRPEKGTHSVDGFEAGVSCCTARGCTLASREGQKSGVLEYISKNLSFSSHKTEHYSKLETGKGHLVLGTCEEKMCGVVLPCLG